MRKPRKKIDLAPLAPTPVVEAPEAPVEEEEKVEIIKIDAAQAEQLKEQAMTLWRMGRIISGIALDVYAPAVHALMPHAIFHPSMPTMGVDKFYRCYFNPLYVLELEQSARAVSKDKPCAFCNATKHHPLAYIAGDIYHEAQHCLRQHGRRGEAMVALNNIKDENWHRKANIAADMEIDDDAQQLFAECEAHNKQNNINSPKICYRKNDNTRIPLPQEMGLEVNHLMEYYYRNLPQEIQDQYMPKDGNGKTRQCGSGATGVKQDYEEGTPSDESPGIDDVDAKEIQKQVAKNIQQVCKTRGEGALGSMLDWANEILPPPVYDWRKEFNREIKAGVSRVPGYRHRNFNNPAKRSAATDYNVIYAKYFARLPKIRIVLDTSGSMYSRGQKALIEIEGICKASKADVDVFCVDWDVYDKQAVRSVRDIKLKGGGGTSMKRGIEQIMGKSKAREIDLMVLVTDGETDYPNKETMKGVPLIVCIVNESTDCVKTAPGWTTNVYIPVEHK